MFETEFLYGWRAQTQFFHLKSTFHVCFQTAFSRCCTNEFWGSRDIENNCCFLFFLPFCYHTELSKSRFHLILLNTWENVYFNSRFGFLEPKKLNAMMFIHPSTRPSDRVEHSKMLGGRVCVEHKQVHVIINSTHRRSSNCSPEPTGVFWVYINMSHIYMKTTWTQQTSLEKKCTFTCEPRCSRLGASGAGSARCMLGLLTQDWLSLFIYIPIMQDPAQSAPSHVPD